MTEFPIIEIKDYKTLKAIISSGTEYYIGRKKSDIGRKKNRILITRSLGFPDYEKTWAQFTLLTHNGDIFYYDGDLYPIKVQDEV